MPDLLQPIISSALASAAAGGVIWYLIKRALGGIDEQLRQLRKDRDDDRRDLPRSYVPRPEMQAHMHGTAEKIEALTKLLERQDAKLDRLLERLTNP